MNILIFIIILLVLVLVHEAGHFFSAKKFGIRVDEFGFGFPPKILGRKFGETEYTLNLLPIGGFVKIFGENPDEENTNGSDRARSFVHKPKWQQALVLFAGVFANFLLAWLLFSFGFFSGLPTSVGNEIKGAVLEDVHLVVVSVSPDSPAFKSGLKSGDKIITIESGKDTITDPNPVNLKSFITSHNQKDIQINYTRGAYSEGVVTVVPEEGMIGISMDQIGTAKLPFFTSLYEGMRLTIFITRDTAVGLFKLIWNGIRGSGSLEGVAGPVGLVGIVGDAYQFGFVYLLSFAALISVNLAIINLLPFPALDGGRLLFLFIEKIKGSRINPRIANMANTAGFAILMILMLLVTYHDVAKLF